MRRLFAMGFGTALIAVASISFAQQSSTSTSSVPNLIRYSGTIRDLSQSRMPGTALGVTFAIYQQQDSGAPLWLETQNVVLDASGHYVVLLGSTRAEGLPADLFSAQAGLWLGVQIQGQPELPRVMLVSVPYAIKAAEADRLAGHSASEFVTNDSLQSAVKEQLQQQADASSQHKSTKSEGSPNSTVSPYIDNGTSLQVNGNFNIDGTGTAANFNATGLYKLAGSPFLGTTGTGGLFLGAGAAQHNTGSFNTFLGATAGQNNTTANYNTFIGYAAGKSNTTGTPVTFIGVNAGYHNTTGGQNFFLGVNAGYGNTTGNNNIFVGNQVGYSNTTGSRNTFIGSGSGGPNTTGTNNTFVGYAAGLSAGSTASNNLYVANQGNPSDNGVIRIGDPANQKSAYIAGVYGVPTTGAPVFIDSTGKLGTRRSAGHQCTPPMATDLQAPF